MKKIIIIDGGPRKNFNTAQLLEFGFENIFSHFHEWSYPFNFISPSFTHPSFFIMK